MSQSLLYRVSGASSISACAPTKEVTLAMKALYRMVRSGVWRTVE